MVCALEHLEVCLLVYYTVDMLKRNELHLCNVKKQKYDTYIAALSVQFDWQFLIPLAKNLISKYNMIYMFHNRNRRNASCFGHLAVMGITSICSLIDCLQPLWYYEQISHWVDVDRAFPIPGSRFRGILLFCLFARWNPTTAWRVRFPSLAPPCDHTTFPCWGDHTSCIGPGYCCSHSVMFLFVFCLSYFLSTHLQYNYYYLLGKRRLCFW